jgi:hypothetical protein
MLASRWSTAQISQSTFIFSILLSTAPALSLPLEYPVMDDTAQLPVPAPAASFQLPASAPAASFQLPAPDPAASFQLPATDPTFPSYQPSTEEYSLALTLAGAPLPDPYYSLGDASNTLAPGPLTKPQTWSGPLPDEAMAGTPENLAREEVYNAELRHFKKETRPDGTVIGSGDVEFTAKNGSILFTWSLDAPLVPKAVLEERDVILSISMAISGSAELMNGTAPTVNPPTPSDFTRGVPQ